MPIYKLGGGKEVSSQNAENYKKNIIDFLKAEGNLQKRDSATHGTTADLYFEDPSSGREILVEAKYTDLSRWNDNFLKELGDYFLTYMDQSEENRFDIYIFVRNLKAPRKWEHIFDIPKRKQDEVEELHRRIREDSGLSENKVEKIEEFKFDNFIEFLGDTYIYEVSYDQLKMKIDELEEKGRYISDFYHKERPPIKDRQEVTLNLAKIQKFPENLYLYDIKDGKDQRDILQEGPEYEPYWVEEDAVYTVKELEKYPSELSDNLKEHTKQEFDFVDWLEGTKSDKVPKILIKQVISQKLNRMGFIVEKYRGRNHNFIPHYDMDEEEQKIEGKQFSRVFDDTRGDPFVKHEALRTDITEIDGDYYLELVPCILFTSDGREMIEGEDAKRLHESFSSRYENNYTVFRDLKKWYNLLGLDERAHDHGIEVKSLEKTQMRVRPPKDSEERDKLMRTAGLKDYE